jgi:rhodanese-related sulfurtransferase
MTLSWSTYGQKSIDELMAGYNFKAPFISAKSLYKVQTTSVVLDAREKQEYQVSRIENALHIGYKNFDLNELRDLISDKNTTLIVYCSVGVRSGKIAEKLIANGYTSVYNLYGGIFDWVNKGYPVYDDNKKRTEKVHVFSKKWGVYLSKGKKVYE